MRVCFSREAAATGDVTAVSLPTYCFHGHPTLSATPGPQLNPCPVIPGCGGVSVPRKTAASGRACRRGARGKPATACLGTGGASPLRPPGLSPALFPLPQQRGPARGGRRAGPRAPPSRGRWRPAGAAAAPPAAGGTPSGREPAGRGRPESSPRRRGTPALREPCAAPASPPGGAFLRQVRWRRRAAGWRWRPGPRVGGGRRAALAGPGKLCAVRGRAAPGAGGGS